MLKSSLLYPYSSNKSSLKYNPRGLDVNGTPIILLLSLTCLSLYDEKLFEYTDKGVSSGL